MFDLIQRLYKKPERKRRIIAVSVSLGITAVIFVIWLSVILPTSINKDVASGESRESSWKKNIASPFDAVKKNTAQVFGALKGQLESVKEAMKANTAVYTAETGSSTGAQAVMGTSTEMKKK